MSLSVQDILAQQNGLYGGTHISDSVGNTGWDTGLAPPGENVFTGNFNWLEVHTTSTLTAESVTNVAGLTGVPLTPGKYGGHHTKIQLSGGDITVYNAPYSEKL